MVFKVPWNHVNPNPAVCWIDTALSAAAAVMAFPLWKVKMLRGCTPPIRPFRLMFPAPAAKVKLRGVTTSLSTVLDNVTVPPPEFKVTAPVNVVAPPIVSVPTVVMLEPRETVPPTPD